MYVHTTCIYWLRSEASVVIIVELATLPCHKQSTVRDALYTCSHAIALKWDGLQQ